MPRPRSSPTPTISNDCSASAPSGPHTAPDGVVPTASRRRRDVVVVLAVLALMLMSMAVGIYLYIVDPGGLEALFPSGAQVLAAPPTRA